MKKDIKIKVRNALTQEVIIDSTVNVEYNFDVMCANAETFSEGFPDCYVTFSCPEAKSFTALMPLNQKVDEARMDVGLMTWEEYTEKWYGDVVELVRGN